MLCWCHSPGSLPGHCADTVLHGEGVRESNINADIKIHKFNEDELSSMKL